MTSDFSRVYDGVEVKLQKKTVPGSRTVRGTEFPVTYEIVVDANAPNRIELIGKLFKELGDSGTFRQLLTAHGQVIIEKLGSTNEKVYSELVSSSFGDHIPYDQVGVLGAARKQVADAVVTVNPLSAVTKIYAHQEFSRFNDYPSIITFFSQKSPPQGGGESITVNATELFDKVNAKYPEFIDAIAHKGIYLNQIWPYKEDSDDFTWTGRFAFGKNIVDGDDLPTKKEKALKVIHDRVSEDAEFLPDNGIRIHQHTQPLRTHPYNHLPILFSSLPTYYSRYYFAKVGKTPEQIAEEGLLPDISYDDGTPIPEKYLDYLLLASIEIEYTHRFKDGDLLYIDNYLVYHGRNPYTGGREVLASFWDEETDKKKPAVLKVN